MISSSRKYDLTFPMSSEANTTKFVWTAGIFAARPKPEFTSSVCTLATIGAMSMVTWLSSSDTAPPPCPVSALSNAVCPARFASTHSESNALLETTRWTVVFTRSLRPLVIGPLRPLIRLAAWGGTPCWAAASESWLTRPFTSIWSRTAVVTRAVTASWTSGFEASGAIVAT